MRPFNRQPAEYKLNCLVYSSSDNNRSRKIDLSADMKGYRHTCSALMYVMESAYIVASKITARKYNRALYEYDNYTRLHLMR